MDLSIKPLNLLLHLGLYISVLLVMKFLYVDPVLRLLRKREALTEGRTKSSQEMQLKIAELQSQYDTQISSVKAELELRRSGELRSAQKEVGEKVKRAQKELDLKLQAKQAQLEAMASDLKKQIPVLGDQVGREMAEAIMSGRVVRS
jgi:F0F1-type ATP synthase membrane subunit b/b'